MTVRPEFSLASVVYATPLYSLQMQKMLSPEASTVWKAKHANNCQKNFDGMAGAMKTESAVHLCSRSEEFGLHYTTFLGEGDSLAFNVMIGLHSSNGTYDVPVVKEECKLQVTELLYPQHPFSSDIETVETMREGILALYYHASRSEEDPRHSKYRDGEDSWGEFFPFSQLSMKFLTVWLLATIILMPIRYWG